MLHNLTCETSFYGFNPTLEPVLRVADGDEVTIETLDCFGGQLKTTADTLDELDWSITNPATGPIYIEGAQPGDLLKVELLEVVATGNSVMVTIPGDGDIGEHLHTPETAILPNTPKGVNFKDKVLIPQDPMIGVIGVAPKEGTIPNSTPDYHGGNMDCKLVTSGSTLYFTVNVEGALFGCGDMHAVMGDGEVLICGAETPGTVRVRLSVVKQPNLPTPFLENDALVATIASAETCDEAQKMAAGNMMAFLTETAGLSANDAGMLMSLVGDLKFCQVVDPNKTVRFEFPKWVLREMGYTSV